MGITKTKMRVLENEQKKVFVPSLNISTVMENEWILGHWVPMRAVCL